MTLNKFEIMEYLIKAMDTINSGSIALEFQENVIAFTINKPDKNHG
jgi:hypothetical protein